MKHMIFALVAVALTGCSSAMNPLAPSYAAQLAVPVSEAPRTVIAALEPVPEPESVPVVVIAEPPPISPTPDPTPLPTPDPTRCTLDGGGIVCQVPVPAPWLPAPTIPGVKGLPLQ